MKTLKPLSPKTVRQRRQVWLEIKAESLRHIAMSDAQIAALQARCEHKNLAWKHHAPYPAANSCLDCGRVLV